MPLACAEIVVREAIDEFEILYRKLTPDERQRSLTPQAIAEFRQNARVGALSRASGLILTALAGKGSSFGVCEPRHSFVLGSSPVLKVAGTTSRLDDPTVEVWLPIRPKIVAATGGKKRDAKIVQLPAHSVRSFNLSVTRKSSMIAGRSKKLICSLAREGFDQVSKA